jgi:hypothetical protein
MVTFDKINRRAHLYLGLFLMPWLLMYGVSSFIVIHQSWFPNDKPARELLFEKEYSRAVNIQGANNSPELRAAAQEILKDTDLEGAFWADKPRPDTLHIDRFSFRDSISLTYSPQDKKLKAERRPVGGLKFRFACTFAVAMDSPDSGTNFGGCSWMWPALASSSGWRPV